MTTVNEVVGENADDGHEYPQDSWNATTWFGHYGTSDLWLVTRFQTVNVPKNAIITSATYTMTERVTEGGTYTVNAKVRAQLIADASAPGAANLPSDFTLTAAGTDLDVVSTSWVDNQTTAVDVTAIIQEIVNQATWAANNDINIVIVNDGTTGDKDLGTYNYEDTAAKAAKLDIEYTVAATKPDKRPLGLNKGIGKRVTQTL